MPTLSIEAAYAPFVAALLAGGFEPPPEGEWSAEMVAAHVVRNNDLIADAAERMAAGSVVAYDNAASVDEESLSRLVEIAGGLVGLAREVERSAVRLNRSYLALGDAKVGTELQVVIADHGSTVRDGLMSISSLIEGNAGFHLDRHYEQLRALQPQLVAEPPAEFDSYQLVLLVRRPDAPDVAEDAAATLQGQHQAHLNKMRATGYMAAAGPIRNDDELAGICIYQAGSVEKARRLAEDDPKVRSGHLAVRVYSWVTAKGALNLIPEVVPATIDP
jgi:uncharacterized protein YciI